MLLTLTATIANAEEPDGFSDNVIDTPLDGGVSLLLAAGVAYGVKKSLKNKKKLPGGEQRTDC